PGREGRGRGLQPLPRRRGRSGAQHPGRVPGGGRERDRDRLPVQPRREASDLTRKEKRGMILGYASSVTIGPEFFGKSFNDYRDKYWAFAREIMQNSIDCGSRSIDISIREMPDDDATLVVVRNDGEPMTEDILVGKLLSLGSS